MLPGRLSTPSGSALLAAAAVLAVAGCGAGAPPEAVGTSASASTVCGDTSVKGMDVSHYDGPIDWSTAKAGGIDFAIVKATEGTTFTDPTFATNWAGMKAAGVVRGAYHFFHSNVDPIAQADYVTMTVGTLEPGDLPIVIDLEVTDGNSESTVVSTAKTFLDAVTKATGVTAMIYTSPAFLSDFSAFAGNPLWVANWRVMCPDVPAPWSTWAFWQYDDKGTVSGVPSSPSMVDLDYFNGTLAELMAFGVGGADSGSGGEAGASGTDGGAAPNDASGDANATGGGDATAGDAGSGGEGGSGNEAFHRPGGCSVGARPGGGDAWPVAVLLLPMLGASRRRRRGATK